jgi:hypothetical protein
MSAFIDLTGQKFGRLTVIARTEHRGGSARWKCRCSCGTEKVLSSPSLRHDNTNSCGCLRTEAVIERSTTHGMAYTPEWSAFAKMLACCTNPNEPGWVRSGARGIEVRFENFGQFYECVGPRPSPTHGLKRIDHDGHFEPGNVCWASRREMSRSTIKTQNLTFNGKTQCLKDWAEDMSVSQSTLWARVNLQGWTIERSLTTPTPRQRRKVNGL